MVNLLVSLCFVSPHVFSRIVAAVDTKRGYMGMCNGRSAQQESGAALSKEQHVYGGGQKLYTAIILGVHSLEIANRLHGMTLHVQLRRVSGK